MEVKVNHSHETIIHIFTECPRIKELWINFLSWIEHKLSVKVELGTAMKVVGYPMQHEHFWPLNFILIITRQYIFTCCKNKEKTNIFGLQQMAKQNLKNRSLLQMLIVKINYFQKMGAMESFVYWLVNSFMVPFN